MLANYDFKANIAKVLEEMQGKTNRAAHFITVLCLVDENGTSYFEGKVHGHLLEEGLRHQALPRPYLVPNGYETTFCRNGPEEKNAISHRKMP